LTSVGTPTYSINDTTLNIISIDSSPTYETFTLEIDTSSFPSLPFAPGEYTYEYENHVKAVFGSNVAYWLFNVFIYKCVDNCIECLSFDSGNNRGECTACADGYKLESDECVECGEECEEETEICKNGEEKPDDMSCDDLIAKENSKLM